MAERKTLKEAYADLDKWIVTEHVLHGSFPARTCGICKELRSLIAVVVEAECFDQWENG